MTTSTKKSQPELVVEEYRSCRELIAKNIDIIESTEVYAVGAAAAAAVFCLSSSNDTVAKLSCWIPILIASLGSVRFIGIDSTIGKINTYLVSLEDQYENLGWTKFYRSVNRIKILKVSRHIIWVSLIAVTGCLAFYITWYGAPQGAPEAPAASLTPNPNSN